jgi:hypothetical protein
MKRLAADFPAWRIDCTTGGTRYYSATKALARTPCISAARAREGFGQCSSATRAAPSPTSGRRWQRPVTRRRRARGPAELARTATLPCFASAFSPTPGDRQAGTDLAKFPRCDTIRRRKPADGAKEPILENATGRPAGRGPRGLIPANFPEGWSGCGPQHSLRASSNHRWASLRNRALALVGQVGLSERRPFQRSSQ